MVMYERQRWQERNSEDGGFHQTPLKTNQPPFVGTRVQHLMTSEIRLCNCGNETQRNATN